MKEHIRYALETAIERATGDGVSRDEINKMIDDEANRKAVIETAKAAAREMSVTIRMLPMECEVWRDPTAEDEVFIVRYGWRDDGYGHTRDEFVRWFGEAAVEQVPPLPE